MTRRQGKLSRLDAGALLCGVVLILAGTLKFFAFPGLVEAIRNLSFPVYLNVPIAEALVLSEVVIGSTLLIPSWRSIGRIGAYLLCALFFAYNVFRVATHTHDPCPCFGFLISMSPTKGLIVDLLMLLALLSGKSHLALRHVARQN